MMTNYFDSVNTFLDAFVYDLIETLFKIVFFIKFSSTDFILLITTTIECAVSRCQYISAKERSVLKKEMACLLVLTTHIHVVV